MTLRALIPSALLVTALLTFVPATTAQGDGCMEGDVALNVSDEGVLVSWPERSSVIVHDIFRKETDMDGFVHIGQASSSESTFLDTTAEPGTTYTYQVVVKFDTTGPGTGQTPFCETPTATAVPVFAAAGGLVATALGVAAYGLARRRD